MPVQRDGEKAKTLVVGCATEKSRQSLSFGAGRMHRGQARDGDRVEPRPDIGREELVDEHGAQTVPEHSQRLGILQVVPVQTLKGLHCRKGTPVHGIDVVHSNRAQQTAKTIAEQTDGNSGADDGRGLQGHVVEQLLRSEDLGTSSSVGSRGGRDGTDSVLLETPWPGVDEFDGLDPERKRAITIGASPTGFLQITTRQELGPTFAEEKGNDDDECTLDGNRSWFELQ